LKLGCDRFFAKPNDGDQWESEVVPSKAFVSQTLMIFVNNSIFLGGFLQNFDLPLPGKVAPSPDVRK